MPPPPPQPEEPEEEEEREEAEAPPQAVRQAPPRQAEAQWFYSTAAAAAAAPQESGTTTKNHGAAGPVRGPLTRAAFLKLVERGVIRAEQTMVYRVSASGSSGGTKTEWTRALDAEGLREGLALTRQSWYYAADGAAVGPVNVSELRRRFEDGAIDGLTTVYWDAAWRAVAEIPGLRDLLVNDHDGGPGGSSSSASSFEALEHRSKQQQQQKAADQDDALRSFVADDGRAFRWDARTQSWAETEVEAVNEADDDDDDDEHHHHPDGGAAEAKSETPKATSTTKKRKKKAAKLVAGWGDARASKCWVYVEGLPADCTVEEVRAHFSKCGVIAVDPETLGPRVKLYRDELGALKGDGSVCYANEASVPLALDILDGGSLRYGARLKVSRADFGEKRLGAYDASKRRRVHATKRKIAKQAAAQSVDWHNDDDADVVPATGAAAAEKKTLRIVVVRGAFDRDDAESDAERAILRRLDDVDALTAPPDKITVVRGHPDGLALVKLHSAADAQATLDVFNATSHSQQPGTSTTTPGTTTSAHFWDGVTNYADEPGRNDLDDEDERLEQFGDWLEDQDLPPGLQPKIER